MPQIIDQPNYSILGQLGGVSGAHFGRGLVKAQDLAVQLAGGHLTQMMQRQQAQHQIQSTSSALQQNGYDSNSANGLAHLIHANPQLAKAFAPQVAQSFQQQRAYNAGDEYNRPESNEPTRVGGAPKQTPLQQFAQNPQQIQAQRDQSALQQQALLQASKNPGNAFLAGLPNAIGGQGQGIPQPLAQQLAQNVPAQVAQMKAQQPPAQLPREPQPIEEPIEPRRKLTREERIASGNKKLGIQSEEEKNLNPAEKKRRDEIQGTASKLEEVLMLSTRMLDNIEEGGVTPGLITSGIASVNPALLESTPFVGSGTEQFSNDASRALAIISQKDKGRGSVYMTRLLERGKPGLMHSLKVNKTIARDMQKEAIRGLKTLKKQNPYVEISPETENILSGRSPSKEEQQSSYQSSERQGGQEGTQGAPQEGWGSYLGRNAAQTGANIYKLARSGFGAGNVIEALEQDIGQKGTLSSIGSALLPSTKQAEDELIAMGVPEEYVKSLPGDVAPYVPQAIILGAQLASGVGIPAAIAGTIGAQVGSEVGSKALGALGKKVGFERTGSEIGSLAGGAAGSLAAHTALSRPSKALPGRVAAAEEGAFEAGKKTKIAQAEATHATERAKAVSAVKKSEQAIPKEKVKFETSKKKAIEKVRDTVAKQEDKVAQSKQAYEPAYKEARKLAKGASGDTSELRKVNDAAYDDSSRGLKVAERAEVQTNLKGLEKDLLNGTMPVEQAKTYVRRFNSQFNKAPRNVREVMNPVMEGLDKFIKDNSSPEHYKSYKNAQGKYKDYISQMNKLEEVQSTAKKDISEIKSSKLSPETQVHLKQEASAAKQSLKATEAEHKALINSIGKEKYETIVNSEGAIADTIKKSLTKYLDPLAKGAIGASLGFLGFGTTGAKIGPVLVYLGKKAKNEISIARQVFKAHPDIAAQWVREIASAAKKDVPTFVLAANRLAYDLEKKRERN